MNATLLLESGLTYMVEISAAGAALMLSEYHALQDYYNSYKK